MRRVLHIGLGKTGTTTFQELVLPQLTARGLVSPKSRELSRQLRALELVAYNREVLWSGISWPPEVEASDAEILLLSYEGLVGSPSRWNQHFGVLSANFDEDVEVLISFRDPVSWMISNYLQVLSMGLAVPTSEYFVNSATPQGQRDLAREIPRTLAPDLVDFRSLVDLYSSYFRRVIAVPMQALLSYSAFSQALGLYPMNTPDHEANDDPMSPRLNTGFSKQAVALTLRRERILRKMGLRSTSYVDTLEELVGQLLVTQTELSLSSSTQRDCESFTAPLSRSLVTYLSSHIAGLRKWHWWMQVALPKMVRTEPFTLDHDFEQECSVLAESRAFWRELLESGSVVRERSAGV